MTLINDLRIIFISMPATPTGHDAMQHLIHFTIHPASEIQSFLGLSFRFAGAERGFTIHGTHFMAQSHIEVVPTRASIPLHQLTL